MALRGRDGLVLRRGARGDAGRVPPEVFAHGGTTGYTMVSDPGEWIGQGKTWTYGPETQFDVRGTRERLVGNIKAANGTTYRATRAYGPGGWIDGGGNGRGYSAWRGAFTVHELAFDGLDLERARITYDIDCIDTPGPFLHGRSHFTVGGDPSQLWMIVWER